MSNSCSAYFSRIVGDTTYIYNATDNKLVKEMTCHSDGRARSVKEYDAQGGVVVTENMNVAGEPAKYSSFYPNGQLKEKYDFTIVRQGSREDQLKQGVYVKFYEDGNIWQDAFYKDGKLHDRYRSYFSNRKPEKKATYVEGKLVGEYLEYHPSKQDESHNLKEQSFYDEKGNAQGVHKKWYSGGELMSEEDKQTGISVKYTEWGKPTEYKSPSCEFRWTTFDENLLSATRYCPDSQKVKIKVDFDKYGSGKVKFYELNDQQGKNHGRKKWSHGDECYLHGKKVSAAAYNWKLLWADQGEMISRWDRNREIQGLREAATERYKALYLSPKAV